MIRFLKIGWIENQAVAGLLCSKPLCIGNIRQVKQEFSIKLKRVARL
jgi:hypothetical protein